MPFLLAVPAQSVRAVAAIAAPYLAHGKPLVICAKGLERGTAKRLSEVVAEAAPDCVPAVLSGPSFATDVAAGLPTAVTIAAADEALALDLCRALGGAAFRPYAETDVVGVEIGGAVKNVLAIACGIVAGTEARRERARRAHRPRLRRAPPARRSARRQPDTLMGLSGLGDLVLTCSSRQSRNFSYGVSLGEGRELGAPHPLVEGIETAAVARDLARRHRVEMPIVEAVAAILAGHLSIDEAIDGLMSRPAEARGRLIWTPPPRANSLRHGRWGGALWLTGCSSPSPTPGRGTIRSRPARPAPNGPASRTSPLAITCGP